MFCLHCDLFVEVDVSRLDMRVGKIVDVKRHPDADTLYVEQSKCICKNSMSKWTFTYSILICSHDTFHTCTHHLTVPYFCIIL